MARVEEIVVPVTVNVTVAVDGETSNFDDVGDFHQKFDLPTDNFPNLLDSETQEYRVKFLREELKEFTDAWDESNLALAADALIDLVYVAMGTAHFMGLPWQELWDEVQRANMSKVRCRSAEEAEAATGRKSVHDVIKPEGWTPPDIEGVLSRWQAETG